MNEQLLGDDDFANAPPDPPLAFAYLEALARNRMRKSIEAANSSEAILDYYLEYITAKLIKPRVNFQKLLHLGPLLAALHGTAGFTDDLTKTYTAAVSVIAKIKEAEEERREHLVQPPVPRQLPAPAKNEAGAQENYDLDDEIQF